MSPPIPLVSDGPISDDSSSTFAVPSPPVSPASSLVSGLASLFAVPSMSTNEYPPTPEVEKHGAVTPDTLDVAGFNMEDGNLLLQTEGVFHRVHWSIMKRYSSYFRDIFNKCGDGGVASPVVLQDVKPKDLVCLLNVLYPSDLDCCSITTAEDWVSVLHLSYEFRFPSAQKLATRMLFPLASPVDKIVYGHRYDIPSWLLDAYVTICERPSLVTQEEGARLGVRDVIAIAHARQELESRVMNSTEIRYAVWRACCPDLDPTPELAEVHASRETRMREARADPLVAAILKADQRRAEAEMAEAVADRARVLLVEAEEIERQLKEAKRVAEEAERERLEEAVKAKRREDEARRLAGEQEERRRQEEIARLTEEDRRHQEESERQRLAEKEAERQRREEDSKPATPTPVPAQGNGSAQASPPNDDAEAAKRAEKAARKEEKKNRRRERRQAQQAERLQREEEEKRRVEEERQRLELEEKQKAEEEERKRVEEEERQKAEEEKRRVREEEARRLEEEAERQAAKQQRVEGERPKVDEAECSQPEEIQIKRPAADHDTRKTAESTTTPESPTVKTPAPHKLRHKPRRSTGSNSTTTASPSPEQQNRLKAARVEVDRTAALVSSASEAARPLRDAAEWANTAVSNYGWVAPGDKIREVRLNILKRKAAEAAKSAAPALEAVVRAEETHRAAVLALDQLRSDLARKHSTHDKAHLGKRQPDGLSTVEEVDSDSAYEDAEDKDGNA